MVKSNDISMYSTYNQGKSVVAERFIRTLNNKLCKHMTAVSKNVYYDVLDHIVKKYNNTWNSTIKMKPKDVKIDNVTEYVEESNEKDPKFRMIVLGFRSVKMCLLRVMRLIGVKKFLLWIK